MLDALILGSLMGSEVPRLILQLLGFKPHVLFHAVILFPILCAKIDANQHRFCAYFLIIFTSSLFMDGAVWCIFPGAIHC